MVEADQKPARIAGSTRERGSDTKLDRAETCTKRDRDAAPPSPSDHIVYSRQATKGDDSLGSDDDDQDWIQPPPSKPPTEPEATYRDEDGLSSRHRHKGHRCAEAESDPVAAVPSRSSRGSRRDDRASLGTRSRLLADTRTTGATSSASLESSESVTSKRGVRTAEALGNSEVDSTASETNSSASIGPPAPTELTRLPEGGRRNRRHSVGIFGDRIASGHPSDPEILLETGFAVSYTNFAC